MSKPEQNTPNTEIIVDTENMEKRLEQKIDAKMSKYMEELKKYKPKESTDKGVVECMGTDRKKKLIEELHNIRNEDVKEQWTVVVPSGTAYETSGHLREYVFVTDAVTGKPGETVNIPYVKDFDFVHITAEADSLTEASSIISTLTTTLHESGRYALVPYADIEMIQDGLMDELNARFVRAAVRAEDKDLLDLIGTHATSVYGGEVNYGGTETAAFYAKYIPEAIGKLLKAGKDVHPGELVLAMTPRTYAALLTELVASQAFTYPRGDVVKSGALTEYLGVKIIVTGNQEGYYRSTSTGTGTYEQCFLFRPKRALGLAPKRDILIETDRLIKERQVKIVGSHTYGVVEIDPLEVCRIISNQLTT
jgi:HK97 family phage major capsid protein